MPSLEQYIQVNEDPAVKKLKNIIRKIRSGEILDLDDVLLLKEYFPRLYEEYKSRMI